MTQRNLKRARVSNSLNGSRTITASQRTAAALRSVVWNIVEELGYFPEHPGPPFVSPAQPHLWADRFRNH